MKSSNSEATVRKFRRGFRDDAERLLKPGLCEMVAELRTGYPLDSAKSGTMFPFWPKKDVLTLPELAQTVEKCLTISAWVIVR